MTVLLPCSLPLFPNAEQPPYNPTIPPLHQEAAGFEPSQTDQMRAKVGVAACAVPSMWCWQAAAPCMPPRHASMLQSQLLHASNTGGNNNSRIRQQMAATGSRQQQTADGNARLAFPPPLQMEQDTFSSCLDGCGSEYEAKMPKLKADIVQQLKRL